MAEQFSNESLKRNAEESVASGEQIRDRIRELTLNAFKERRFNFSEFQDVLRAMTEGISLGAEQRGTDVNSALAEAFAGMDQALTKAAQAGSLALRELASRSRQFSDNDLISRDGTAAAPGARLSRKRARDVANWKRRCAQRVGRSAHACSACGHGYGGCDCRHDARIRQPHGGQRGQHYHRQPGSRSAIWRA